VTLRSGVPFTPVLSFDRARAFPRAGGDGQRPDWAPGFNADNAVLGGPDRYYDPNAFTLPDAGTFGNVPRNALRGPGYAVWNGAVFKNIELGGRRRLQLRVEAFNLFNTVNLGNPVAVLSSPVFGQIQTAGDARVIQLGLRFEF
jgi:hypothetical protein